MKVESRATAETVESLRKFISELPTKAQYDLYGTEYHSVPKGSQYVREWWWWKIVWQHPKKTVTVNGKKIPAPGTITDKLGRTRRVPGAVPKLRAVRIPSPEGFNPDFPTPEWDILARVPNILFKDIPKKIVEEDDYRYPWYTDRLVRKVEDTDKNGRKITKRVSVDQANLSLPVKPPNPNYPVYFRKIGEPNNSYSPIESIDPECNEPGWFLIHDLGTPEEPRNEVRTIWVSPKPFKAYVRHAVLNATRRQPRDRVITTSVYGDTMRECISQMGLGGLGWGSVGAVSVLVQEGSPLFQDAFSGEDIAGRDLVTVNFAFVKDSKSIVTRNPEFSTCPEESVKREVERTLVQRLCSHGFRMSSDERLYDIGEELKLHAQMRLTTITNDPKSQTWEKREAKERLKRAETFAVDRLRLQKLDNLSLSYRVSIAKEPLTRNVLYTSRANIKEETLRWLNGLEGIEYSIRHPKDAVKVYARMGKKITVNKLAKSISKWYSSQVESGKLKGESLERIKTLLGR